MKINTKDESAQTNGFVSSLGVFRNNLAMINRHNVEADQGLHSYTMKINQFADIVRN